MITTDEKLIEMGFDKYERYMCQNDSVIYNFQKCYRDADYNKLFFLDVAKWDWSFAKDKVPEQYTYCITTQLYKKGDHEAIDIEFGSNITIEDAEKFIYSMFDAGLIEPYEY